MTDKQQGVEHITSVLTAKQHGVVHSWKDITDLWTSI